MLIAIIAALFCYSIVITILLLKTRRGDTLLVLPTSSETRVETLESAQKEQLQTLQAHQARFQDKADEALRLTQTFQKFVPRQFVEHFAKHGESSLELGRADEDDVAILFCDIRGFTGLSEKMRPQELMKFLNSYFLRMNDPIHQNHGFIDKFIGDAIMALFDRPEGSASDKANDALQAALDLHSALAMYNQHRANSGYSAIDIGIGIHYGAVIIGTVGSDDRMDTTVIGDSVNIASRLEAMTSQYEADIIVSEQLLHTANSPNIKARVIDWVKVKGRQSAIKIYEVVSHLSTDIQIAKLSIAELIENSIEARKEQRWEDALALLHKAKQYAPNDKLVTYHIDACEHCKMLNLPDNWDGALAQ